MQGKRHREMVKSQPIDKVKTCKRKSVQAFWQCSALFVLSALLALTINQFQTDRLALIGDWSVEGRLTTATGERLDIPLAEAEKLFTEKRAVFFDARSREEYESGHISGARSLPWHDVDQQFIEATEDISLDTAIITYCDGETCNLSHDLAMFLKAMGFSNVRVLVNGWTVWQESRLPVEKGNVFLDEG